MAEEKVVEVANKEVTEQPKRAPKGDRPQRGPRKDGKKPIDNRGLNNPLNVGEAKNAVADGYRLGWIVPNKYIVIDIDNHDSPKSSQVLEKILYIKDVKFANE